MNASKKCPKCFGEVDARATKCKHCASPIYDKKLAVIGCSSLIIAFGVLVAVLSSASPELTPEELAQKNEEVTAIVCAKQEVENQLVSPSSADFPFVMDATLGNDGETYVIKSYVDSDNAFGANIRTDFGCFVKVTDASTYACETECVLE